MANLTQVIEKLNEVFLEISRNTPLSREELGFPAKKNIITFIKRKEDETIFCRSPYSSEEFIIVKIKDANDPCCDYLLSLFNKIPEIKAQICTFDEKKTQTFCIAITSTNHFEYITSRGPSTLWLSFGKFLSDHFFIKRYNAPEKLPDKKEQQSTAKILTSIKVHFSYLIYGHQVPTETPIFVPLTSAKFSDWQKNIVEATKEQLDVDLDTKDIAQLKIRPKGLSSPATEFTDDTKSIELDKINNDTYISTRISTKAAIKMAKFKPPVPDFSAASPVAEKRTLKDEKSITASK